MAHAFIYDHLRTPRGKGRPDGALHEITPVQLAAQTLQAIRDRNGLDTRLVEDVIFGTAMPSGEQGSNLARTAAVVAGYAQEVPGVGEIGHVAAGITNLRRAVPISLLRPVWYVELAE